MQLERWENEVFQIWLALSKCEAAIRQYISYEIEKLKPRFLSLIIVLFQTKSQNVYQQLASLKRYHDLLHAEII